MTTKNKFEEFAQFKFTFQTEAAYNSAEGYGYIPDFDIVRIVVDHGNGCTVDFPCKSRESFERYLKHHGDKVVKAYSAIHYYDVQEYA